VGYLPLARIGRAVQVWRVKHLPLITAHVVIHVPVRRRRVMASLRGVSNTRDCCASDTFETLEWWLDGKLSKVGEPLARANPIGTYGHPCQSHSLSDQPSPLHPPPHPPPHLGLSGRTPPLVVEAFQRLCPRRPPSRACTSCARPSVFPRTGHSWQRGRCIKGCVAVKRGTAEGSQRPARDHDRESEDEGKKEKSKLENMREKNRRQAAKTAHDVMPTTPPHAHLTATDTISTSCISQPELMLMLAAMCQPHRRAGDEHHLFAERARFVAVGLFRLATTRGRSRVSDPGPRIGALQRRTVRRGR
jgi:hypothetical protein